MTLTITLNGAPAQVTCARLDQLIDELGYPAATVATALNEEFVPRDARAGTTLKSGDRLEVVAPLQGG